MTLAFLTRDWNTDGNSIVPGGCTYYRCYLPAAVSGQRARLGKPVFDPFKGFGVQESGRTALYGFNTVILKLLMDRATSKQMDLARHNCKQRFIVDIDDYYQGLTPANKAYDLTHPDQNKKTNRDYYEQVIANADLITVSTPFLLDYYSNRYPNVVMVRNGVNLNQFNPIVHQQKKPVLGWAGATSYRNNDLEQLREWLPDFLEEHNLTFHHAGDSPDAPTFAEVTGINPRRVTTSPLVPITKYANGFKFDIGIVPLNNIPFNEAKSNIKGLEYAAAGIPFVASDLPEYRLLHETGVGELARTAVEWQQAVLRLLDWQHRKNRSQTALTIVRNQWSIEQRAGEWRDVFRD